MKIIKVDDDIWEKLMRLKLDLKVKSLSKTISKLFKLTSKFKLRGELNDLD